MLPRSTNSFPHLSPVAAIGAADCVPRQNDGHPANRAPKSCPVRTQARSRRYNGHMIRCVSIAACAACLVLCNVRQAAAIQRVVSNTTQFSTALAAATTGDDIVLQPGVYGGGHYRANLDHVTIRTPTPDSGDYRRRQQRHGLSDPSNVTLSDLVFRNQVDNGLNIDDAGTYDTPANNITIRNVTVRDIVTAGNHDGIKLSGVNDFLSRTSKCSIGAPAEAQVDMVGCHRGLIQNSNFTHTNAANGGTTLKPKGGTKDRHVRANRIDLPRGSGRGVQAGGSTGTQFFRFVDGDSGYEANRITAEGNVIIGGSSAFSWVNIDGGFFTTTSSTGLVSGSLRILNENQGPTDR